MAPVVRAPPQPHRVVHRQSDRPGRRLRTYAGFLHGYVTIGTYFVPAGSIEQQSMYAGLGGIVLLGLAAGPASESAERAVEFLARLAEQVDTHAAVTDLSDRQLEAMETLIRTAFSVTPDVAITATSLAGFTLGVLYAVPYLSNDAAGPVMLLAAVRRTADQIGG